MIGSGPKRDECPETPREVVAGMCVDSLEQPQTDPDVDGKDVKVLSEKTVEKWTRDRALSQDEDFEGVGILSRLRNQSIPITVYIVTTHQADGSRVGMMQLQGTLVGKTSTRHWTCGDAMTEDPPCVCACKGTSCVELDEPRSGTCPRRRRRL